MSKKIEMEGKTFGRLTVIRENERSKTGQIMWLCKCVCGSIIRVRGSDLRNGSSSSCGCYQKQIVSQKLSKDLTGQMFGRLKIIGRDEDRNQGRRAHWLCECACGNRISVDGASLRNGHTKSCGCYGRSVGTGNLRDITGKVFSKLTVIRQDGRTRDRAARWLCRCECGKEKTISATSLLNGSTGSCGCLRQYEWKGQTFRSKWEVWLSMYYDAREIGWTYEPFTMNLIINGKETRYTPDFLIDNGCIIEVKGREEDGRGCRLDKPLEMIKLGYDLMIFNRKDLEMVIGVSIRRLTKAFASGGFLACETLISSLISIS